MALLRVRFSALTATTPSSPCAMSRLSFPSGLFFLSSFSYISQSTFMTSWVLPISVVSPKISVYIDFASSFRLRLVSLFPSSTSLTSGASFGSETVLDNKTSLSRAHTHNHGQRLRFTRINRQFSVFRCTCHCVVYYCPVISRGSSDNCSVYFNCLKFDCLASKIALA